MLEDGGPHGKERGSLSSRVFHILEDEILSGKLSRGDSLVETEIASRLGVSRTPVREALRQLELDELVRTLPNRGTVVMGVSPKDMEDIFTIRVYIEGLAARWAAEKMDAGSRERLSELLVLQEFYTQKGDFRKLQEIDSSFHELIYEASGSWPLRHTLAHFHHYVRRARELSLENGNRALRVLREHRDIAEAIAKRDADAASHLMGEHIKNAREYFLGYSKQLRQS